MPIEQTTVAICDRCNSRGPKNKVDPEFLEKAGWRWIAVASFGQNMANQPLALLCPKCSQSQIDWWKLKAKPQKSKSAYDPKASVVGLIDRNTKKG